MRQYKTTSLKKHIYHHLPINHFVNASESSVSQIWSTIRAQQSTSEKQCSEEAYRLFYLKFLNSCRTKHKAMRKNVFFTSSIMYRSRDGTNLYIFMRIRQGHKSQVKLFIAETLRRQRNSLTPKGEDYILLGMQRYAKSQKWL